MLGYEEEMSKRRGNIEVVLENIGEGVCGDYDESDPEDMNLLRFTVYKYPVIYKPEREQIEDASYCTRLNANLPDEILDRALDCLFREFWNVLKDDEEASVKKLGESLSWISEDDFTKPYPVKEEDRCEFIGQVMDCVEDFLEEKGITIEGRDDLMRDAGCTEEEIKSNAAILYGEDYDALAEPISSVMKSWGVIKK